MKFRGLEIQSFLRFASVLIILGLVVEVISLWWIHPLAFALFAVVGVSLIGLGILAYLASLVFAVSLHR